MKRLFELKEVGLWVLMALATALSFFLTYTFHFSPPILAIIWIVWLLVVAGVGYFTSLGQTVFAFSKEAKVEMQKVVWPTRQETVQTTSIVMAMVAVTGVLLWMLDSIMMWVIAKLTHIG